MYSTNINARTRGAAWLIMLALLAAIIPLGLQAAPVLPIVGVLFEDAATQTNVVEPSDSPAPSVEPSVPPSVVPSVEPSVAPINWGDADCDGKDASITDILFVKDVIFGEKELSELGRTNLNMKADDRVSIFSILFIRDVIFGILPETV